MAPKQSTFYSDGTAEPGTVIDGRYEVLSTVGRGGFAVVFKARQLSTGQVVALKVMRPHRVSDQGVALTELARFSREMDLIGRLNHPHIVGLIDSGSFDVRVARQASSPSLRAISNIPPTLAVDKEPSGSISAPRRAASAMGPVYERKVPYIVMEFLDDEPLSTLIADEAPIAPERVVELLLPVISAVATAHLAGVIHRDLKPPNILIAHRQGRPHPNVLDFGIAKLTEEGSVDLTADAQLLGTPEYMSPEQAQGESDVNERSDQYTIGVILYEACTGQRPFKSESFMKLVHMISAGKCKNPSEVLSDVPSDFEEVIMRAMSTEPSDRYSSLETLGRALLPFASQEIRARWEEDFTAPSDPPATNLSLTQRKAAWQSGLYSAQSTLSSQRPMIGRTHNDRNLIWVWATCLGFAAGVLAAWVAFQ